MEKMKVAIVGLGKWGKVLAPAFDKYASISFLVHNDSPETKEWAKSHFPEAKATRDLDLALNDKSVKAVAIATPINTHFEIALKALKAKKHVFLEKPATDSSEKLGQLISAAEQGSLNLQIGYEFIFAEDVKDMRKIIDSGEVTRISFEWKKWGSFEFHPVINLLVHELSILKAIGVWPIDITRYIEAEGDHKPDGIRVEAKSKNIEISFDIDRVSMIKEKTVTIETKSEKFVWKDGRAMLVDTEVKAFLDSIQNQTKPVADGQFAKEILETIEKIPYRP